MTDGQLASLSRCQAHIWDLRPIFLLLSLITFLDTCGFVDMGRPLPREVRSVVFSYCWASPAESFFGSESRGAHDHILLSPYWDPPNLDGKFPVHISPGNRVAQLYPQALGDSWTRRSRTHVTTDSWSVSQSVSMWKYRAHSETCDQYFLS
jgi:hypothetical protein